MIRVRQVILYPTPLGLPEGSGYEKKTYTQHIEGNLIPGTQKKFCPKNFFVQPYPLKARLEKNTFEKLKKVQDLIKS